MANLTKKIIFTLELCFIPLICALILSSCANDNKASLVNELKDALKVQAKADISAQGAGQQNNIRVPIKSDISTKLRDDNKGAIQGDNPIVINNNVPKQKKGIENYILYAIITILGFFIFRSHPIKKE